MIWQGLCVNLQRFAWEKYSLPWYTLNVTCKTLQIREIVYDSLLVLLSKLLRWSLTFIWAFSPRTYNATRLRPWTELWRRSDLSLTPPFWCSMAGEVSNVALLEFIRGFSRMLPIRENAAIKIHWSYRPTPKTAHQEITLIWF